MRVIAAVLFLVFNSVASAQEVAEFKLVGSNSDYKVFDFDHPQESIPNFKLFGRVAQAISEDSLSKPTDKIQILEVPGKPSRRVIVVFTAKQGDKADTATINGCTVTRNSDGTAKAVLTFEKKIEKLDSAHERLFSLLAENLGRSDKANATAKLEEDSKTVTVIIR